MHELGGSRTVAPAASDTALLTSHAGASLAMVMGRIPIRAA